MLKYVYGFATRKTNLITTWPFLNVTKLSNVVPYFSQIVSYIPFMFTISTAHTYNASEYKLHHNIEISESLQNRPSKFNLSLIHIECKGIDAPSNIPSFLKPHVEDEIRFKWFPEFFIKVYMKKYSVDNLVTGDSELESDLKSMVTYGTLKHVASSTIEKDICFFEAIYEQKENNN